MTRIITIHPKWIALYDFGRHIQVSGQFKKLHNRRPLIKKTNMKYLGHLTFSAGLLLLIYAFTMDISVAVDYVNGNEFGLPERVNNLGLMADRQNYMILGGVLAVLGFIAGFASDKKSENESAEKVCPKCAEKVKKEALVCRYCSYSFEENKDGEEKFEVDENLLHTLKNINTLKKEKTVPKIEYKNCPACNTPIQEGEKECSDCGLVLE